MSKKINFAEAMAHVLEGGIVTDGLNYYKMSCSRLCLCSKTGEKLTGMVGFEDVDLTRWYVHHIPYTFEQAMKKMSHGNVMWFNGMPYCIKNNLLRYEKDDVTPSVTYDMATSPWHDVNTKL